MLQCAAVHCGVLQCVQCVAVLCSMITVHVSSVEICCSVLPCVVCSVAVCHALRRVAVLLRCSKINITA